MAKPHDALLAAYEAAVDALTPLPRIVFLLHRVDDLSYRAIADLLSLDRAMIETCMAHALKTIACHVDGRSGPQTVPEPILRAEAALLRRHGRRG
jgi:DNA-directed RNA polymerase specialized sigma24 family protein